MNNLPVHKWKPLLLKKLVIWKKHQLRGTLSAVAPLLGLLGTVISIIESFLVIDLGTNSNPTLMIPGISKALITTAAGMFIAIPALFAYRYFQRLVQEYIAELEQQSTLFHAALFYQNSTDQEQDIRKGLRW